MGQKAAVTKSKMQKTRPKTNKSRTTNKPRRASKTNSRSGDTNSSVHADENVTIENHNQQQTDRKSSRKRKSTSHQAAPNRVRLSKLGGSDSSSESEGDSDGTKFQMCLQLVT